MLLAWNSSRSGSCSIEAELTGRKLWGSKHHAVAMARNARRVFTSGGQRFHQPPGVEVRDLAKGIRRTGANGTAYLVLPNEAEGKWQEF